MTRVITVDYVDAYDSPERDVFHIADDAVVESECVDGVLKIDRHGFHIAVYAPGRWNRFEDRITSGPPDLDEQAEELARHLWRATQTHYSFDGVGLSFDEAAKSDREHYRALARAAIEHGHFEKETD